MARLAWNSLSYHSVLTILNHFVRQLQRSKELILHYSVTFMLQWLQNVDE